MLSRIHCNGLEEDIIPPDHHCGRKGFATVTAKAVLNNAITKEVEEKKCIATLGPDLQAGFNLINTRIKLKKKDYVKSHQSSWRAILKEERCT